MPRDHARIFTAIWGDDDFRERSAAAQRLYALLLTQRELTYAGVLELRIQRWAGCAPDTTVDDVRAALSELERERFVVVDYQTEEVLVRSYIRRNEVWKQPKLMTLALRHVSEVQSKRLRSALREELLRLPEDPRVTPARTLAETLPDTPWFTPSETLPDTPTETPSEPLPEPIAEPTRVHAGARETSNHEPTSVATSPNAHPSSEPRKRGTRIPDEFTVTSEMVEWARANAPHVDGRTETAKFLDYWRSQPGQRGVKLDWQATWRNWIRNAEERQPRLRAVRSDLGSDAHFDRAMQRAQQRENGDHP